MKNPRELIDLLAGKGPVFVQTHNFPDHDSIASAYGMQNLMAAFGIPSRIIYDGSVQRESLNGLIKRLGMETFEASGVPMTETDTIVIVDGCKGNKNVTDLPGREVAVIDHHEVASPDGVTYADIRPGYGACSTIVCEYFRELGIEMTKNVATALLVGLEVDTALMTRGVELQDLEAYSYLYVRADTQYISSHLRNSIQVKDFDFYRKALDRVRIDGSVLFCYFDDGCNQNLMGVLGDFFLTASEIDMVCLCAKNSGVINFSMRSEKKEWNAAAIMQRLLSGIGFGGGHADMAGGIIKDASLFDEDGFFARLVSLLGS